MGHPFILILQQNWCPALPGSPLLTSIGLLTAEQLWPKGKVLGRVVISIPVMCQSKLWRNGPQVYLDCGFMIFKEYTQTGSLPHSNSTKRKYDKSSLSKDLTQSHKTRIKTEILVSGCCILFFLPFPKCLISMWWKESSQYMLSAVDLIKYYQSFPSHLLTNTSKTYKWKYSLN